MDGQDVISRFGVIGLPVADKKAPKKL